MNYASFFSSDVTVVTGCAAGADTGRAAGSAGFGAAVAAGFSISASRWEVDGMDGSFRGKLPHTFGTTCTFSGSI